jgi:hypothetical protein
MSVTIGGGCVVVRSAAVESRIRGGVPQLLSDSHAAAYSTDGHLLALTFPGDAEIDACVAHLRQHGFTSEEFTTAAAEDALAPCEWLDVERVTNRTEAWLHGSERGDASPLRRPFRRLEILSRSNSGLAYVRENRSGLMRVLTEEELRDFEDPRPCEECGEQFGCDHYNCAGERLFAEDELDAVPSQWQPYARDLGLSRGDLERLRVIERSHEGDFRVAPGAASDMRTLELVLLLNGSDQ